MAEHGEYSSSLYAEFYDILHTGLGDVDAYAGFADRYGPRVLELGCGTGRLLIPLANAGFRVTGVDASRAMLDACRRKMQWEDPEAAARIRLVEGDILDLCLGERFDLVVAPCNLLNHFLTTENALQMLKRAYDHLTLSGTFILDNSIPDTEHMVKTNGIPQTFEFTHPITGTTIALTCTGSYDLDAQMETDHIVLEEFGDSGLIRREESRQILACYFPREVRALIAAAGFQVFHEQGSLLEDVPISPESGEMVFLCRKNT